VTVPQRGKPIAASGKYSRLVAEGKVRLSPFTTDDIDRRPMYTSDRPGSLIQTIIDMQDEDAA
jgi:hypothetical protein